MNKDMFILNLIKSGFGAWFKSFMAEHGITKDVMFNLYMNTQKEMLEHLWSVAKSISDKDWWIEHVHHHEDF